MDCPPQGKIDARIAIIAEAPGETEVKLKSPLVGGSGKLLWDKLKRFDIDRTQCWVTNVIKRQLVQNRFAPKAPIASAEYNYWCELLRWELGQLKNCQYVLILGGPALNAVRHSGENSIDDYRGSCERLDDNRWYTYTYNPAFVIREPKLETIFMLDLAKFDGLMRGKYVEYKTDAIINPSPREAIDWCTMLIDNAKQKPVAFDIETIAGETACIGLGNDDHQAMCINFRTRSDHRFSLSEETQVRLAIGRVLQNPNVKLVAQNGNFDSYWLWYKDRIRVRRVWFDTLLAHHTLYPQLPHNLGFIVSQYTWHPYYKNEKDEWREKSGGDIDDFWRYNVKDVCLTLHCHRPLLREIQRENMEHLYFRHIMRLNPHLARMTVNGVLCDVDMKEHLKVDLAAELEKLREDFYIAVQTATGDPEYRPNPLSHIQVRDLLFNRLHLSGRGQSTGDDNRERMMKHHETNDAARLVLTSMDKFKKAKKFFGTYVEMELDEDNRFRCEYSQYSTVRAPGRLGSKAVMWGNGGNLQNQPQAMQKMFIADEGWGFVYFDMSQIEARLVAWIVPIPAWQEQFEYARLKGGYDCHRALCAEMFKIPYDQTPEKDWNDDGTPTLRYIAKRCRHGLNYRMGPDILAVQTGLSMLQATDAYVRYHKTTPILKSRNGWWHRVEQNVRDHVPLHSIFGRKLLARGRIDDAILESCIAFEPQSTAGDHVASVIYKCMEDAEWPRDKHGEPCVSLNIHDALITLCPLELRSKVIEIQRKYAEAPLKFPSGDLIIPAEFGLSQPDEKGIHRWSTIKKIK